MANENHPTKLEAQSSSQPLLDKSTLRQLAAVASMYRGLDDQIAQLNRISLKVPKIYVALPKIDTSIFDKVVEAAQRISSILKPLDQLQVTISQVAKQFQIATQGFDQVMKRITADLAAFDLAFQSIDYSGIFDRLSEFVQARQDAVDAFRAAGWPIAPSMPIELQEHVVELHQQGKIRYASQSIMGYYQRNYHENLVRMVDDWQNHRLFQPRMHIIRDALDAHREGKYTLSVPALIPQIEGILNDYVKENNLAARFGKIQEVYTAAIGNPEDYGLAQWAITKTLLYQLQTNTYVYTNFEDELRRTSHNRQTTRHTVLHGVATKYDRPIHSLKAFLLLDAISVLEFVEQNDNE